MTMLKQVKVLGQSVRVDVSDDGEFSAHVAGEYFRAPQLKTLLSQVRTKLTKSRVKVAVPATLMGIQVHDRSRGYSVFEKITAVSVLLTGFDPRDGSVQVSAEDSAHTKLVQDARNRFGRSQLAKRMTPKEVEEYERLEKAEREARAAFNAFKEEREMTEMRAKQLVQEAIAAKTDTPQEPEEEPDDPRLR